MKVKTSSTPRTYWNHAHDFVSIVPPETFGLVVTSWNLENKFRIGGRAFNIGEKILLVDFNGIRDLLIVPEKEVEILG